MREEVWLIGAGLPSTSGSGFRGRLTRPAQRLDSQLLGAGVEETRAAPELMQAKLGGGSSGEEDFGKRNIGLEALQSFEISNGILEAAEAA